MEITLFGYAIIVKKARKRDKPEFGRRVWTRGDIEALKKLTNDGESLKTIAQVLNRTVNAVQAKRSKIYGSRSKNTNIDS